MTQPKPCGCEGTARCPQHEQAYLASLSPSQRLAYLARARAKRAAQPGKFQGGPTDEHL